LILGGSGLASPATTTCNAGSYTFLSWTLTNGEGSKIVTVSQTDATGNPETTLQRTFSFVVPAWRQEAYIKASNSGQNDLFGNSVFVSGDSLAVGAWGESSNQRTITNGTTASADNSATSSGAVYVYRRSGTIWVQEAYVKAANADAGDNFGSSVSLSGDSLAVGARGESSSQSTITNGTTASADNSASRSGAVYVYSRIGTNWVQEAYIKAVNADSADDFGFKVSLSGDTLAVGALGESSNQTTISNGGMASAENGSPFSGAVYIYRRSGSNWAQEAYVKAANSESGDIFGYSVSLSGDTLAVASPDEDSNQTTITNGTTASAANSAPKSGAVYVYRRSGAIWAQEAYIKAANAESEDTFGVSVSLSGDSLAVGADGEDSNQTTITNGATPSADNSAAMSGAVYVYRRIGNTWAHESYLKAANAESNDWFGISVSLSGGTLAVGAYLEDSHQTTITNGGAASADNSANESGAVYVYLRSDSSWTQEAYIKAANSGVRDLFGGSVSLSGDTLAVGAVGESSNQTTITNGSTASSDNSSAGSGAAYIYRFSGRMFDPDVRVSGHTTNSITVDWHSNLGTATQVKVAPAVVGMGSPAANCSDAGAIILAPGVKSYTFSGLSVNTKYGFRICAWTGTNASEGATVWSDIP
jgi:hypothetical protein